MKSSKHDKGTLHTRLARFLLSYRNALHSTTNETPSILMFDRRLRTHLDLIRPNIQSKVAANQQQQAKTYSQASMCNFHMGDTVLARDYRGHQRWRHGTIHACTGSHTYEV
ncbi:transposon tf2-6 polyprotein [Plakobranchus ocellatus]|uniref:Transposon tf2-6 polyprotein n=1 Tax=Plakobranchus ocellatus TaxID=259542 RepID=A0AAV4BTR3_9GAST|nr:transposon tf2-6 polyprotein [Plakobranchus ocellatus]